MVIRLGLLAFIALGLQLLAIYAPLGPGDLQRRLLLVLSYVLLGAFVLANLRRPGIAILGAGLLLNFLAIVANGGLMPVSPRTLERTDGLPAGVSPGEWVPDSKDVLLEPEDTHLRFLTDTIVLNNVTPLRAFSVGDVIVGAGLAITLVELLLPRPQRAARDRPSVT